MKIKEIEAIQELIGLEIDIREAVKNERRELEDRLREMRERLKLDVEHHI